VKRISAVTVSGELQEGIRVKLITGAAAGCPGDGAAGLLLVLVMPGVLRPGEADQDQGRHRVRGAAGRDQGEDPHRGPLSVALGRCRRVAPGAGHAWGVATR
jgi:hypothetical protein